MMVYMQPVICWMSRADKRNVKQLLWIIQTLRSQEPAIHVTMWVKTGHGKLRILTQSIYRFLVGVPNISKKTLHEGKGFISKLSLIILAVVYMIISHDVL